MIVFPMAGLSSRFAKAGYRTPKYMLDLNGRPLFYHTINGFSEYFASEQFAFVYRDVEGTREFIMNQLTTLGLAPDRSHLIELDAPTSGQAETVAIACRRLPEFNEHPLLIFNIDTIRPRFKLPQFAVNKECDGYLEVFRGEGDHWSFVEPMPSTNLALRVTEKVRVSNLCSTGLYQFKRASSFLSAYASTENIDPDKLQGGERYVAPLYNSLIADGQKIRYQEIDSQEVLFSGTPDEYEELLRLQRHGALNLP